MPKMKMSYREIRAVFPKTDYGTLSLELTVGLTKVCVKDAQGIKGSFLLKDLRASEHVLVRTCRESDADKFNDLCDKLESLHDETEA